MAVLVIKHVKQITEFLPTQWSAQTEDGRPVYIRFKYGQLTVNVGAPGGTVDDAVDTPDWYNEQVTDDHDDISFEEICRLAGISVSK